jgi:hypothetical protein
VLNSDQRRSVRVLLLGALAVCSLLAWTTAAASAASSGPVWAIRSIALPSRFSEEDSNQCDPKARVPCDGYLLRITNLGAEASGPITIRDNLPHDVVYEEFAARGDTEGGDDIPCSAEDEGATVKCTDFDNIKPLGVVSLFFFVKTKPGVAASVLNEASVESPGAATAVTSQPSTAPNPVTNVPQQFGFEDFSSSVLSSSGTPDVQAGDHPETVTTTINYTALLNKFTYDTSTQFFAVAEPKTTIVNLPPGFAGDANVAARCPESRVDHVLLDPENCPAGSVVGEVYVEEGFLEERSPIYIVVPEPGYPAEYAFEFDEAVVYLRAQVVPSAAGYVLRVSVPDIARSSKVKLTGASIVFFGAPSAFTGAGSDEALLTDPSNCDSRALNTHAEMDSWVDPGQWVPAETSMFEADAGHAVTGCEGLSFEPSLEVTPEETTADTPTGYEVDLRVPQAANLPGVPATPDLKDATVSLPEGVSLSPGAGSGLVGCRETGPEGINITHGWTPTGAEPIDAADPEAMEVGADGLAHIAPGHCPQGSQIGEAEVKTPDLAEPLRGHVYVAEPECGGEGQNECTPASASDGELYGLYLEVAGSGVIVKLKGAASVNPQTGQITTSFEENPQLPFSELKLRLEGGQRAPLANPQSCGSLTATSDLVPWSTPVTPDARPISSFSIGGCVSPTPFAPTMSAGPVVPTAGASGAFTLTLSRADGTQDFSQISTTLPAGLVGLLATVPLCDEAQANAGSCPEASQIGTTTVASGAGGDPLWLTGKVYLTGPWNGAPFGLSVVVPAKAGPYNLGDEVVRAGITIDAATSAVTVTTAPLPQSRDGVPFRLKTINVDIDRAGFMQNPTACASTQSVTGKLAGSGGAVTEASSSFDLEGCSKLAFKPSFSVSVGGRASKADGAGLVFKFAYPSGSLGQEAWFKRVKLDVPKQLPARQTTLEQACLESVFEANPAACPSASRIGYATVRTEVLPVPLEGPVFFVSYGGAKFPDVVMVLQGDGVTVDLTGETFIDKQTGVTSATFASVPGVPFESTEVRIPTGPYSEFGSGLPAKDNYDFCGQKLTMPIELVGQNGDAIHESKAVTVTGCAKAKTKAKKTKNKAKKADRARRARAGRAREQREEAST